LTYWMLRGWTTPLWSLVGGLLAVMEFGPLNPWMNSYWGGSLAAAAGCLVFGALPRMQDRRRGRDAALLGAGFGLHFLVRPYESIFLALAAFLFFGRDRHGMLRPAGIALLAALPALALTFVQNKQVTGSWTTLPYMLSRYQYGVPASFTFEVPAIPHRELTPQQQLEYKSQLSFRSTGPETLSSYLLRLEYRVRFYRFFFLAPLYVALFFFCPALRGFRFFWVVLTPAIFALGVNFYPFFEVHYLAALTCLFVLISVTGLRRLGGEAAQLILFLCAAHFVFWYTVHLVDNSVVSLAMRPYETWDAINHDNPERRILVIRELEAISGKQLVLVRYWPQHLFQEEWVYNEADIDKARIVWARDLGDAEDEKLLHYYPDRMVWLLEPDARPPKLSRYVPSPPEPPPASKEQPPKSAQPTLRFEQVR